MKKKKKNKKNLPRVFNFKLNETNKSNQIRNHEISAYLLIEIIKIGIWLFILINK